MALKYSKPETIISDNKPIALPNKNYPYSALDDRRFEELLYSIGKQRIRYGDWKDKYDAINLLQGVRERGRDCSLHKEGKSVGLIQCKHSIDGNNRIDRPECAREIIKFVLHSIVDNSLIHDTKYFTYWFAVSYGFNEKAKDLLDDFNNEILKQKDLKDWTEQVINGNKTLEHLKYSEIESELKNILKAIKVKKLIPQDIDKLLNSDGYQPIVKTFFEVRAIVDSESLDELSEKLEMQNQYQTTSKIPIKTILQKFDHASYHLTDYNDSFYGVEDSHIARKETKELLNWIKSSISYEEKPVALLVGSAGSGKTVILKDTFKELKQINIPVMGLKADRYYAESIRDLENKIDIEDTIEKVVRTLSLSNEKVVILIDQIDALSQSLSAKREYLDAYNLLVKKLIDIDRVRVVISVREYDLNYDNELRFYRNQKAFKVGLLESDQVKIVLSKLGIENNTVPTQLLNLLRTPHHLNVFCKIYNSKINLHSIRTLHDLYNQLWIQHITMIPSSSLATPAKCEQLSYSVAQMMHNQQRISTNKQTYLIEFSKELEYMKSIGIITEAGDEIQFFHQTFFDYVFAKQFVQNGESVLTYMNNNHQGLFIRSSLKMILGFLREQDHKLYTELLEKILTTKKYRFHIRLMLLNILGFEENPSDVEKHLAKSKILYSKKLKQPFLESVIGTGWLKYLIELGELDKLLSPKEVWCRQVTEPEWKVLGKISKLLKRKLGYKNINEIKDAGINLLWQVLVKQLPMSRKKVCKFLLNCKEFEGKSRFVFRMLYYIKRWDIPEAFQLFDKYEAESEKDRFGYYKVLEDAILFDTDWVFEKYKSYCLEKVDTINSVREKPNFKHEDEELLKKMFEEEEEKAFDFTLELVKRISDKTCGEDKTSLYGDLAFWLYDHDKSRHSYGVETVYHILIDKTQEFSERSHPKFIHFFNDHKNSNSETILKLLFFGFAANPSKYPNEIFQLMKVFSEKGGLEGNDKIQFQFRQLLKEIYSHFNSKQKDEMDKIILSVFSENEQRIYIDNNGKKRHNLNWYGHKLFLYLCSIPIVEVLNRASLRKKYLELERKFKSIKDKEPNVFSVHGVGAPMERSAYDNMTFDQWETTFKKYDTDFIRERGSSKGRMFEHATAFQNQIKKNPSHFFPFIEKIIGENTVPYQYIIKGLNGLKEAEYDPNEVQRLYKKTLRIDLDREYTLYFVWISSYFIESEILDEEVLNYLIRLATTHPDPETSEIRNNALNDGANNVRGAATSRISQIYFNPKFETAVFDTLNQIAEDPNITVRISMMPRLAVLMNLNEQKTLKLFLKLIDKGDPEIMEHSIWSVQYLANNYFDRLKGYFQKAIEIESLQGNIAVVLGVAWLKEIKGSYKFLETVLRVSDKAKAKVLDMATKNMKDEEEDVRRKCRKIYLRYLNSSEENIIQEYSSGFLDFTPEMFPDIYPLLQKYARSKVAKKSPHYYFEYLLKCAKKHPHECLELLQQVTKYDKPDISEAGYYDEEPVKLLLSIYNSLSSLEIKDTPSLNKCIKLFDKMLKISKFRGSANKVISQVET